MSVHTQPAGDPSSSQYDAIFGALSNYRCRLVLYRLSEADVPLALADLVREIATGECDSGAEPSDATVQSHYLAIHHTCIPKLVDADLVVHDSETDVVKLSEDGIDLEGCLAIARRRERPT